MAIALVQNSASVATGSVGSLPVNSTAGNLLVAVLAKASGGGTVTFTGPSGWSEAVKNQGVQSCAAIWYYPNTVGGQSSFTFTPTSCQVIILEYSGVATALPLDTSGGATAASSPISPTTAGNIAAANELAIGSLHVFDSKADTTTLAMAGLTNILDNGATSLSSHTMAGALSNPTSGATLSSSMSSTSMNLTQMSGVLAVFNPASSIVNASITQVAATLTFTGGTQTINTSFVGKDVQNGNNNFGAIIMQAINRGSTY